MSSDTAEADLKTTPLTELHKALGARMVPFAGYLMPVQFEGVMAEHLWTRQQAGLFDVSHMGQVWIDGPDWDSVARGFERLVPQDVSGLEPGRQRYGFLTNAAGGIEDDLMMSRAGDRLFVVVNAACKETDLALMKEALEPDLDVTEVPGRALLALQGPGAEATLEMMLPGVAEMAFMDNTAFGDLWLSRSGYTGEDGFEISVPADQASDLANRLLSMEAVRPVGLGARDSLRLEAGLCLYGHDIDSATTPVEAGLTWAIQKLRRTGGARAGGFPGADVILGQIDAGAPRRRVGLRPEGRAPMREGTALFAGDAQVGTVTSGGFGPTVGAPVAMGYVAADHAAPGTSLSGEVRGKRLPLTVTKLPFTPANFKR